MAAANNNTQGDINGDVAQLSKRMDCLEQLVADIRLTLMERQVADIHLTLRNLTPRAASFNTTPFSPTAAAPQTASLHFLPSAPYAPPQAASFNSLATSFNPTPLNSNVTPPLTSSVPPNHTPAPTHPMPPNTTHFTPAPLPANINPASLGAQSQPFRHTTPNESCKLQNLTETQDIIEAVSAEIKAVSADLENVVMDEKDNAFIMPCVQLGAQHTPQQPHTRCISSKNSSLSKVQTDLVIYKMMIKTGVILSADIPETIPPEPPPLHLDLYLDHSYVKIPQVIQPLLHDFAANLTAGCAPFNIVEHLPRHKLESLPLPHRFTAEEMAKTAEAIPPKSHQLSCDE